MSSSKGGWPSFGWSFYNCLNRVISDQPGPNFLGYHGHYASEEC